ncbi:MAG: biphenyl-2,3-diol 1,2-dioxygenase [Sciscionella sp.]
MADRDCGGSPPAVLPPVLLLHGWGGSRHCWTRAPWVRTLHQQHREVIELDLPGHGSGAGPHDPAYYADLTSLVQAQLPSDTVLDIVGFSLGGKVALQLAHRRPDLIRRLVVAGVAGNLFRRENGSLVAEALRDGLSERTPAPVRDLVVHALQSDNDLEALLACLNRPATPMTPAEVRGLSQPVLLAVGDDDGFIGPVDPLHECLPQAQLQRLPGINHLATPYSRELLLAARDFLAPPYDRGLIAHHRTNVTTDRRLHALPTRRNHHQKGIAMAKVTGIGYIGIGVSDVQAWEDFSQELGFQLRSKDDDGTLHLRMDQAYHRVVVHPTGEDDLTYVGWQVSNEAAFAELKRTLESAGVPVEVASDEDAEARSVAGLLRFRDPNGIASEVYYGLLTEPEVPYVSPHAVDFVTDDQGFGHIVLIVDDYNKTMQFYRDVLGLQTSDLVRVGAGGALTKMAFLRCNPRQHSLAFWAAKSPRRINHFMLQTKGLDSTGQTLDRCFHKDIPATNLGRHVNDYAVSFYITTPSGFMIEYGWGAREVEAELPVDKYRSVSIWGHRTQNGIHYTQELPPEAAEAQELADEGSAGKVATQV